MVGLGLGALLVLASGCRRGEPEGIPAGSPSVIHSEPHTERDPDGARANNGALFERLKSTQTGITLVPPGNGEAEAGRAPGALALAVTIGDVNGDERPDLFFASGPGDNVLYLQTDPSALRYFDMSESAGVTGRGAWATGAAIADVDGDGDNDIYVTNAGAPNQLFVNNGASPPGFDERAAASRLDLTGTAGTPAFADYDRDGDLDCFLLAAAPEAGAGTGAGAGAGPAPAQLGHLLRNDGEAGFVDVSLESKTTTPGVGAAAAWLDFNGDGRPDLFVAGRAAGGPSGGGTAGPWLFMNNGDGTFIDLGGIALPQPVPEISSVAAADFDGNGLSDLAAAAGAPQGAALYLNSGTVEFLEASRAAGVHLAGPTSWVEAHDFDLDGKVDLVLGENPGTGRPAGFRNLGGIGFLSTGEAWFEGRGGSGRVEGDGSSVAIAADLDSDGDIDLVTAGPGTPASVYRNTCVGSHAITFRLEGRSSHTSGAGAVVTIETPDLRAQSRAVRFAQGSGSSGLPRANFGTGVHTRVVRTTIDWPSGLQQKFENLAGNRSYTIREPVDEAPVSTPTSTPPPLFAESGGAASAIHSDAFIFGPAANPTAPVQLSRLGPGVAVSDVDGDGDDDFYLGGGAGQSGSLQINGGDGTFTPAVLAAFAPDRACEDMAAVFFDADGDGDEDLFVASGGVEHRPGSIALIDRLYLSQLSETGTIGFELAPLENLPAYPEASSCAAVADFDRDGDLDLFVGSLVTPGRFPFAPANQLLVNRGDGVFDRATAPAMAFTGVTAAALWSDATGDGWPDLVTASGWGPVQVFENLGGAQFRELELQLGVRRHGMWNSLAAVDVDLDGDLDYAAGNAGLNSRRLATAEEPLVLFAGDLDGRGAFGMLEAVYESGSLVALPNLDAAAAVFPSLRDRFATPESFRRTPVEALFEGDHFGGANHFPLDQLASGVFINDGTGRLSFQPFPALAQLAPVLGIASTEINGDASPDLVIVQNPLVPGGGASGQADSGCSLVLTGAGDGSFDVVPPARSGLIVRGGGRSAVVFDADGDSFLDILIGMNNAPARLFLRSADPPPPLVHQVELSGPRGNPTAIGARVTFGTPHGVRQIREISAGGGFLSAPPATATFAPPPPEAGIAPVFDIHWPDATHSTHPAPPPGADGSKVHITHPSLPDDG